MTRNNEIDIGTAETEERRIPSDVEELFDARQDEWRDDVEWEKKLRALQKPSEQEREATDRLVELVAAGLCGELDDSAELLAAYEELKERRTERLERVIEHHEQRDWSAGTEE